MTIFVKKYTKMSQNIPYSISKHQRLKTITVNVGNLKIGSEAAITIQSMCNTPTTNVEKSIHQAIQIIEAGGELIRYTVRHQEDLEGLKQISSALKSKGYTTPLVADIHFNAKLAKESAAIVEKVRINPGNFVDKRAKFVNENFTDEEWNNELLRVEEELKQLIDICKTHKTALRIGINHGSLSDRIMSRYGNTIEGMVESAMEFLRICKKLDFQQVVISMKSSNVKIMVQAYRKIIAAMQSEQMSYPLHLGVTEAGDGLAARIKSAAGTGALLADGIGDTIRVSLTENPVNEIPVAKQIIDYFTLRPQMPIKIPDKVIYNPFEYKKRTSISKAAINKDIPSVVIDMRSAQAITKENITQLGYKQANEKWIPTKRAAEYLFVKTKNIETALPENLTLLYEADDAEKPHNRALPVLTRAQYVQLHKLLRLKEKWVYMRNEELTSDMIEILKKDEHLVIILETTHANGVADQRAFFLNMRMNNLLHPVIIKRNYIDDTNEAIAIKAASDVAPLFIDGFGEGIWLSNPFMTDIEKLHEISFEILQAARARSSATDFIACPSCGRTQFDIETVLKEIKIKTSHLYHLKIAVMGCIVNGPGEMADADYGYVGSAPDKVALYKGKEAIKKNIPASNAVDELILLIKENGDWIEP